MTADIQGNQELEDESIVRVSGSKVAEETGSSASEWYVHHSKFIFNFSRSLDGPIKWGRREDDLRCTRHRAATHTRTEDHSLSQLSH